MTITELSQILGNFGEFVGAIAVVATLVYLAIQVRHSKEVMEANTRSMDESRQAMIAQTVQARMFHFAERTDRFAESEHVARIQLQLNEAGFPNDPTAVEQLDDLDRLRMWSWMTGQALVMSNAATQFELGYENEEDYGDFRRAAHMTFQGPMKAFGIEPIGPALNRLLAEEEEQS